MDRTLILVKPDAFARGLTGEIIARFERKGLRIAALELRLLEELDHLLQLQAEVEPVDLELVDRLLDLGSALESVVREPFARVLQGAGRARGVPCMQPS